MSQRQPYFLVYAEALGDHLSAIDAKHHSLIRDRIREELQFEPGVETRNRKPLRQPAVFGADWEIRFGPNNRFRVLYPIHETEREVHILAIGTKGREWLFIGGKEVKL